MAGGPVHPLILGPVCRGDGGLGDGSSGSSRVPVALSYLYETSVQFCQCGLAFITVNRTCQNQTTQSVDTYIFGVVLSRLPSFISAASSRCNGPRGHILSLKSAATEASFSSGSTSRQKSLALAYQSSQRINDLRASGPRRCPQAEGRLFHF